MGMDGERLIGRGGEVELGASWRSAGSAPWAGRDVRVWRVVTPWVVEMEGYGEHAGSRRYATEAEALAVAAKLRATRDALGAPSEWTVTHPQGRQDPASSTSPSE
ncbi:hypothetical protein STSO111631_20175 [Stackebrandtia soli]